MRKVNIKIDSVSYEGKTSQEFEGLTVNECEFEFSDENNKYKIILGDNSLTYKSEGKSKVNMEFNLERESACTYETPYGSIPMKVKTTVLSILKKEIIKIVVHYVLDIDGAENFWSKEITIS